MIWYIACFVLGGTIATIVVCCFAANGVTWWRGRAEHLEKLICLLAKHYPVKLWQALPPSVQDECQQIIEKSYRKEWEIL